MGGLNVASGRKYLEGGDLKGFAIAAAKRSKHLPNMPTLSELGVDMIYALDRGIVVPKGTPADKIEHWAQLFKKAAADPDLRKQMDAKGTEVNWVGPAGYRECAQKPATVNVRKRRSRRMRTWLSRSASGKRIRGRIA